MSNQLKAAELNYSIKRKGSSVRVILTPKLRLSVLSQRENFSIVPQMVYMRKSLFPIRHWFCKNWTKKVRVSLPIHLIR